MAAPSSAQISQFNFIPVPLSPQGAMPQPFPVAPYDPAMMQAAMHQMFMQPTIAGMMDMPVLDGSSVAYNAGAWTAVQQDGPYFPSTWVWAEQVAEQMPGSMPNQVLMESSAWPQNDSYHQAAPVPITQHPGKRATTQHRKKQRQHKASQILRNVRAAANDDDDLSTQEEDEEDKERNARIEAKADALLKELRCSRTDGQDADADALQPRALFAIAEFVSMAFKDTESSRTAQKALCEATAAEQVHLAFGLHGQVLPAMQNKNANYVITKLVEVMPMDRTTFIVEELVGHGYTMAKHRFGCRVLCRILEHLSPRYESHIKLLDEVLTNVDDLCTNAFGSIVMRHFLEHGLDEHRAIIAASLGRNLLACASQRKGSHVVEAALQHCSPEALQQLVQQLLAKSDELWALANGQFGRHVIVAMLNLPGDDVKQQVVNALMPMANELSRSKHGKFVYSALMSDGNELSPSKL